MRGLISSFMIMMILVLSPFLTNDAFGQLEAITITGPERVMNNSVFSFTVNVDGVSRATYGDFSVMFQVKQKESGIVVYDSPGYLNSGSNKVFFTGQQYSTSPNKLTLEANTPYVFKVFHANQSWDFEFLPVSSVEELTIPEVSSKNTETRVMIVTNPDVTYQGDFWDFSDGSGIPLGIIVEGDVQDKGLIKLSITGIFTGSIPITYEKEYTITSGNPKHLFNLDFPFQYDELYSIIATNGDYSSSATWIPLQTIDTDNDSKTKSSNENDSECYEPEINTEFYSIRIETDSNPKLGKVLSFRVFNEDSKTMDGIISLYPKCTEIPTLQREHLLFSPLYSGQNTFTFNTIDYGYGTTLQDDQSYVLAVDAYAPRNSVLDQAEPITIAIFEFTPKPKTESNPLLHVTPTQINSKNAKITVLELEQLSEISGKVTYKICANVDLTNPSFVVKSDAKKENVVEFIELKKGQCHEGSHILKAMAPSSISIPLAITETEVSTGDIDQLRSEIAELKKKIEDKDLIIMEQVKVISELALNIKNTIFDPITKFFWTA